MTNPKRQLIDFEPAPDSSEGPLQSSERPVHEVDCGELPKMTEPLPTLRPTKGASNGGVDERVLTSKPTPLRITDATTGFDFQDLLSFRVPSTIPGEEGEVPAPSQSLSHGPAPGQRVGRYLTEEILGRGGMGLVLRARDDLLQRDVALKVILPQYLETDPAAGFRFLREAEIVARLEHPHIIRVLDAGLDAGVAYLAFEYKRGETYSSLRDRGTLQPQRVVDLMMPILSALSCAHAFGVVHGDLKPSNLLLSQDYAGREHPWVLDFGVSFFSGVEAGLDPTRKRVSGTPGYLAPEWLESSGVDGRADCFSLGCVLYEMLAGKGPFAGLMRLSQAAAAAQARNYPAITLVSAASKELATVIERSLEPDPNQRYASLRDMAHALLPHASPGVRAHYASEFC
jgi:serine/threonine protein kinase